MIDKESVKWINSLIEHKNIKAFYVSSSWLTLRSIALKRDNYECQRCKTKGLYSKGECVHHKQYVRKHPELALTLSNLETLCNSCHNEAHPEKFKRFKKILLNEEKW